MHKITLLKFAFESNKIEGILSKERAHTHAVALEKFLALDKVEVDDLKHFVGAVEPFATYRPESKHEVMIGGHFGMGSLLVHEQLLKLLKVVNSDLTAKPNTSHIEYERIHPFTDCNGRSGRALWFWQMHKRGEYWGQYGFLRMYYYETFRGGGEWKN